MENDGELNSPTANKENKTVINTPLALCRLVSNSQTKENSIAFLTKLDFLNIQDWKNAFNNLVKKKDNRTKVNSIISEMLDLLNSNVDLEFTIEFRHLHLLPPLSPSAINISLLSGSNESICGAILKSMNPTNSQDPQDPVSNEKQCTEKSSTYAMCLKRKNKNFRGIEFNETGYEDVSEHLNSHSKTSDNFGWQTVNKASKKKVNAIALKSTSTLEKTHIHIKTNSNWNEEELNEFLSRQVVELISTYQLSHNERNNTKTWFSAVVIRKAKSITETFTPESLPLGMSVSRYFSKFIPTEASTKPRARTLRLHIGNLPKDTSTEEMETKIKSVYESIGDNISVSVLLLNSKLKTRFSFAKIQIINFNENKEPYFTIDKLKEATNNHSISNWRGPDPSTKSEKKHLTPNVQSWVV